MNLAEILEKHKLWLKSEGKIGERAKLSDEIYSQGRFRGADLAKAELTCADLTNANLAGAKFYKANLAGADFTGANLNHADFLNANLTGANLTGANLTGANLINANLTGANFTDANLSNTYLKDANLTGAQITMYQRLDGNFRDDDPFMFGLARGYETDSGWNLDKIETQKFEELPNLAAGGNSEKPSSMFRRAIINLAIFIFILLWFFACIYHTAHRTQ